MGGVLRIALHLVLALPLWLGVLSLFRRLGRHERLADFAIVASVVPPTAYLAAALARLSWPVSLAAFLGATVALGLAIAAADYLAGRRQRRRVRRAAPTARRELAVTLRSYADANHQDEAVALIDGSIDFAPYDRLKMQLLWATTEVYALRRALPVARVGGVPDAMIERVTTAAATAAEAIWAAVGRAAAAAAQGLQTPTVEEAVRRESCGCAG